MRKAYYEGIHHSSGALGKEGGKSHWTEKTALGGLLLEDDFVKSLTFLKKRQRGTEKENKYMNLISSGVYLQS